MPEVERSVHKPYTCNHVMVLSNPSDMAPSMFMHFEVHQDLTQDVTKPVTTKRAWPQQWLSQRNSKIRRALKQSQHPRFAWRVEFPFLFWCRKPSNTSSVSLVSFNALTSSQELKLLDLIKSKRQASGVLGKFWKHLWAWCDVILMYRQLRYV